MRALRKRQRALAEAQRVFDRGAVDDAASLLSEERRRADDDHDAYWLAETDKVIAAMRERLEGDDRLTAFDAQLSEPTAAADGDEAVDVTPLSLGIALVGAGLMLIAVFLPQFESNTFARIEKNTLIQNGGGWWFIILTVLSAGAAYRAYRQQRRTFAPVVFGAIGIAVAIYEGDGAQAPFRMPGEGTARSRRPASASTRQGSAPCLSWWDGWQMFRAQRVVVEDEDEAAEPEPVGTAPASIADRLRTLDQLKAEGLISDAEHEQRRTALLEQV